MKSERRKRIYNATRQEIKEVAWEQITQDGAAALSLRAIAKQIGVTSPALYHYYPSRDALVNELVAEAFNSVSNAMEEARDALPNDDHARRFLAISNAYREWAQTYPQRYVLIFGAALPNYQPALDTIQPAADRALGVLVEVVGEAWLANRIHLSDYYQVLPPPLEAQLEEWKQATGLAYPVQALYIALIAWCRIHGIVSLELRQQFPPIADPAKVFWLEAMTLLKQIGMDMENSDLS